MRQVVYATSRVEDCEALYRSVKSVRRFLPDAKVKVFVTTNVHRQLEAWMFDYSQVVDPKFEERPRFEAMLEVPFGETLFLDCDTLAIAPLESMFKVLLGCQIALSPAINHSHPEMEKIAGLPWIPSVPECIGEWNGGVIMARVDANFRAFLYYWMAYYRECRKLDYRMDQAALRCAVWNHGWRVATLRNNYNFRTMAQQTVVGEVKILHGHGDLESVALRINESLEHRLYTPTPSEAGPLGWTAVEQ